MAKKQSKVKIYLGWSLQQSVLAGTMCKNSKVRPQNKNSCFHMCFGFVLALSYCLLMHHSYDTVIAVSQGFITLWAGVTEKHSHGISLKIHVNKITTGMPTGSLACMTFSVCRPFPWRGAGNLPGRLVLPSLAHHDWLMGKLCAGAEQWLNKPVPLEAVQYLNFCHFPYFPYNKLMSCLRHRGVITLSWGSLNCYLREDKTRHIL